jgi:hypothetical protein
MAPAERGRHCQHCCKTVVDFTGMTDDQVLRYFRDNAGKNVCGRLMPDQVERELSPEPVQRNGLKGWSLVVAGALVMGQGPGPWRPGRTPVEVRAVTSTGNAERPDTSKPVMVGGLVLRREFKRPAVIRDSVVIQGDIGVVRPDDTVPEMPMDTVRAIALKRDYAFTGEVAVMGDTVLCRQNKLKDSVAVVVDTLGAFMKGVVDSVAGMVDSVAAAMTGGRPGGLKVYPNPVVRSGVIWLIWEVESGRYQVTMISARGVLVEERMFDVAGKGQSEGWVLPGGLAAGVYYLRVTKSRERALLRGRPFSVEVLVQ